MWKNVNKENVKELPHGIDGLSHFLIKNIIDVKAQRKALSSDGRRWSKDSSTRWAEYGDMRFANCRGSYVCRNEACPYKIEYGIVNRLQLTRKKECTAYGISAEFIECPARRYTRGSKDRSSKSSTVVSTAVLCVVNNLTNLQKTSKIY